MFCLDNVLEGCGLIAAYLKTQSRFCVSGNCAAQRQRGKGTSSGKNKDQPCHSGNPTIILCSLPAVLCAFSVSEGIVLNISERFTQTKSLIFVKYWCKLNKEQQICPKET